MLLQRREDDCVAALRMLVLASASVLNFVAVSSVASAAAAASASNQRKLLQLNYDYERHRIGKRPRSRGVSYSFFSSFASVGHR